MPAPLAKGIIIAASVLVAAGIAIYENPQVREWVDQSRRKIAVALHSLGDDVQPRRSSASCDAADHADVDARQQRREELIRRNRNELVRRAREEGVAVDLDELARIGDAAADAGRKRQARTTSFDEMVGNDGKLKGDDNTKDDTNTNTNTNTNANTTATDNPTLRRRGVAAFATGSATTATLPDTFSDDNSTNTEITHQAAPVNPFLYIESSLIDLTPDSATSNSSSPSSPPSSSPSSPSSPSLPFQNTQPQIQTSPILTPTRTPRSSRSLSFDTLSMQNSTVADANDNDDEDNDNAVDTRSEVFSEGGFTDAGFSEAGTGVMTPSSWTEVGSDNGSEWGG